MVNPTKQGISQESDSMRIAIPLVRGQLSLHFGHCDEFAIVDVNSEDNRVSGVHTIAAPAHAPGVLPQWLRQQNVNVVIASGMGSRAQMLFAQNGIEVVVGAPRGGPEEIAVAHLNDALRTGTNICNH
jgi:predicted Fe-Mo cluster-binding NifX family protein